MGSLALGPSATPLGAYWTFYSPDDIEVVRHTVPIPSLPRSLDGLTAVQLSDLHVSDVTDVHRRMIDEVLALKPHLVLVSGDLVDVDRAVEDAADLLGSLQPPNGTWTVP